MAAIAPAKFDKGYNSKRRVFYVYTLFKVQFILPFIFNEIIVQHASTKIVPAL